MLKVLINFVKERKQVSLSEMAIHLEMDKSAVQGMADQLIQREYIKKVDELPKCKGCIDKNACQDPLYIWNK